MTFMMKRFATPQRRDRSRPVGGRIVSCEVLECRQLLSGGMRPRELAGAVRFAGAGGSESRWAEMAPTTPTTGTQGQVVTNVIGAGFAGGALAGQGGGQGQAVSVSGGALNGGPVEATSSMGTAPGAVMLGAGAAQGQAVSLSGGGTDHQLGGYDLIDGDASRGSDARLRRRAGAGRQSKRRRHRSPARRLRPHRWGRLKGQPC